jgi:hypothetical protein
MGQWEVVAAVCPDVDVDPAVVLLEFEEERDVNDGVVPACDEVDGDVDLVEPGGGFGGEEKPGERLAERFPGVLDGVAGKGFR